MTTPTTLLPPVETPVREGKLTPPPSDLGTALALIATLKDDIEDLLAQRNAAEETVRRYATQADLDRLTIREWERLSKDWTAQRALLESRLQTLEKAVAQPPRIHLHLHVHQGGVVNVLGGTP